jgi:rhomboid family GlyGly-CTERM serine protease
MRQPDATDAHRPRDDAAWLALSLLLAAGTGLAWLLGNPPQWEWWRAAEPEPLRWWSAALVHRSGVHALANLLALGALAVLGLALQVPRSQAWAWALAWPLSTLGLWAWPALTRYAGLSGVLHAAVAVLVVHCAGQRGLRWWAVWLGVGLAVKLLSEAAWRQPLVFEPQWGFVVAPAAHLSGALAGLLCALLVYAWRMRVTRAVVE